MNPASVSFTGLVVDPSTLLLGRIHRGPIPSAWLRVSFSVEREFSLARFNKWVGSVINCRWAVYAVSLPTSQRLVFMAFENDSDAVMFKLRDGENSWRLEA